LEVHKVYLWALVYIADMRLEPVTAVYMKFIVIWYVMPHRLLERYQHFRDPTASIFRAEQTVQESEGMDIGKGGKEIGL
jgi:hypothetical protein